MQQVISQLQLQELVKIVKVQLLKQLQLRIILTDQLRSQQQQRLRWQRFHLRLRMLRVRRLSCHGRRLKV